MMLPFLLEDIEDENLKMMMLMNSMGVQQNDPISQILPLMLLQARVRDSNIFGESLINDK